MKIAIPRLCSAGLLAASCAGRPAQPAPSRTPHAQVEPQDDDAAARQLVARVEHAIAAWDDSCPRANEWGLCVEFSPVAADPSRCGSPVLGAVVVHPRSGPVAAAAQAELVEIMDVAGCDPGGCDREVLDILPADPEVLRAYKLAMAKARLARADADLEAYFAKTLPDDARLTVIEPTAGSLEPGSPVLRESPPFSAFVRAKVDEATPLLLDLARVKEYQDVESIMEASLRTSWASLHLFDELRGAPIPAKLQDEGPARDDFCRALDDRAAASRTTALEAAKYCTIHADQSNSRSHTARTCRALLERLAH